MSRAAPILLIAASVVILAGFLLHPVDYPDAQQTVDEAGDEAGAWALAHWVLAVGGVLLAAGAFLVRGQGGLTGTKGARIAWLALAVSAILALEVFVVEATLGASALDAGDVDAFEESIRYGIPGVIGLFGLSVSGLFIWVGQGRSAPSMAWKVWSCVVVAAAGIGLLGLVAFGVKDETLANLQYATGLYIIGFAVLGIRMMRPAPTA